MLGRPRSCDMAKTSKPQLNLARYARLRRNAMCTSVAHDCDARACAARVHTQLKTAAASERTVKATS